jgi:hypothetical protein
VNTDDDSENSAAVSCETHITTPAASSQYRITHHIRRPTDDLQRDGAVIAMQPGLAGATEFVASVPAFGLCPTIAVAVGQDCFRAIAASAKAATHLDFARRGSGSTLWHQYFS